MLFLIPIGGGIPAGVLLAKSRGIHWPLMVALYFISDVVLACVFEPLMLLFIRAAKNSRKVARFRDAFREAMRRTLARHGTGLGPLALLFVSLGVDPMTGRAVAAASGHGFLSGWALAIAGDLIYFAILMVSTLWLGSVLGDGTLTMVIILALMMIVPEVVKRIKRPSRPA